MRIRRKPFKPTLSQLLTVAVGLIAVTLIFSIAQKSVLCQQKQAERDALVIEVKHAESTVEALQEQLDAAGGDAVIESNLREDFGLVGRNEGTAILQFEGSSAEPEPAAPTPTAPTQGTPPFWVEWVKALLNP